MKKLIVLSVITALIMLLTWGSLAPAHAQDAAKDDEPTFYRLVAGTYVNGWPRFTISYPRDWLEQPSLPQEVFRAGATAGYCRFPGFCVTPTPSPVPLDKVADLWVPFFKTIAQDVTLVSAKPTHLRDGTLAHKARASLRILFYDCRISSLKCSSSSFDTR
jgi:hypothetical protein